VFRDGERDETPACWLDTAEPSRRRDFQGRLDVDAASCRDAGV
jgi:hypothetical protein